VEQAVAAGDVAVAFAVSGGGDDVVVAVTGGGVTQQALGDVNASNNATVTIIAGVCGTLCLLLVIALVAVLSRQRRGPSRGRYTPGDVEQQLVGNCSTGSQRLQSAKVAPGSLGLDWDQADIISCHSSIDSGSPPRSEPAQTSLDVTSVVGMPTVSTNIMAVAATKMELCKH